MTATVILTGVNRGLGRALFDALHGRGDRILGLARRFSDLPAPIPGTLELRTTDLTDPAALPAAEELAAFLAAETTEVVLIHNAGVVDPIGPVGTLDAGAVAAAVRVNLLAPVLLTNAFLAAVAGRGLRVRILFVSSGAAARPIDGWSVYCATKAGGELFFATVAEQFAGNPLYTVVNVNPGVMDTGMQASIREARFPGRDRFTDLHERGELPTAEDVARRILAEHLSG